MKWFSKKPVETRSNFTSLFTSSLTARAENSDAKSQATAAVEACSGVLARAFAAAEISGPENVIAGLTPGFMAMIGRALIRRGELVAVMEVTDGRLMLLPSSYHDVWGSHRPSEWVYRCTLNGPTTIATQQWLPADSICHFMYHRDPEANWRGISATASAAIAGRLSAETASVLADISSGPRGSLLPLPNTDGDDPTIEALKRDIKNLAGQIAFVESTSDAWQSGSAPPRKDWEVSSINPSPTQAMVDLNSQASREVLMANGLSPALFDATAAAAAREAWRQALHQLIAPCGRLVQTELRAKIHPEISISWDNLMASDLTGRARAFSTMATAGMELSKAAQLSGLMAVDDDA